MCIDCQMKVPNQACHHKYTQSPISMWFLKIREVKDGLFIFNIVTTYDIRCLILRRFFYLEMAHLLMGCRFLKSQSLKGESKNA